MKNVNLKADGSVNGGPVKGLEEKIATSFERVNLVVRDPKDSPANTRLGVVFDWSKETMIIQSHR